MPMYEYALKVGNSFVREYEEGPLLTDDWEKAVEFLKDTLWTQANYENLEKFNAMSEEELLLEGEKSNPRVRIVRRRVSEWKTAKQPKKKKGGQG